MFDPDLVEQNLLAREAFKMLRESGICDQQLLRMRERAISGDPDESDDKLIETIRKYRLEIGNITSLMELGEKYSRKEGGE
jgi:hypothetical protein